MCAGVPLMTHPRSRPAQSATSDGRAPAHHGRAGGEPRRAFAAQAHGSGILQELDLKAGAGRREGAPHQHERPRPSCAAVPSSTEPCERERLHEIVDKGLVRCQSVDNGPGIPRDFGQDGGELAAGDAGLGDAAEAGQGDGAVERAQVVRELGLQAAIEGGEPPGKRRSTSYAERGGWTERSSDSMAWTAPRGSVTSKVVISRAISSSTANRRSSTSKRSNFLAPHLDPVRGIVKLDRHARARRG